MEIMGVRFSVRCVSHCPLSWFAAARRLQRQGVRCCIFPREFHGKKVFARRGIVPVETGPLVREKAAELCLAKREEQGLSGAVAVYAEREKEDVRRTVEKLLPHVRRISLGEMRGGETLRAAFLYEKGLALSTASREELAAAETLILFAPPRGFVPANLLTLPLYGGAEPAFFLREELEAQLPPEIPRLELLAALRRAGALKDEDIFPRCD